MKIPKGQSESVDRRRTNNIMAIRKRRKKGQTTIYKTIKHTTKDRVTRTTRVRCSCSVDVFIFLTPLACFFSSHFVSHYGFCVAHIVSFIAVLVEHQTKIEYTNIHTQHRQLKRCATRNTPKICSG